MFGMTQDQFLSVTRQVITVVGMLATTLGWLSPASVGIATSWIMGTAGPVFVLGSTIWSLYANTHAAILTSAANLTDAQGNKVTNVIQLNPSSSAAATLAAPTVTPSNVVVAKAA